MQYLAELGFEKVKTSPDDLEDLHRAIRRRSGAAGDKGEFYMLVTLVTLFFGVTLFFASYSAPEKAKSARQVAFPAPQTNVVQAPVEPATVATATEELESFIQPSAGPEKTHPAEQHPEPAATEEIVALQPRAVAKIPGASEKDNGLRYAINSPVTFIEDLKVTSYHLLYFKKNSSVPMDGVPANFMDKEKVAERRLPDAPRRYLHRELADALKHYRKGEYQQCINTMNEVAEFNDDDLNASFYRGMSYYQLRKYKSAIPFLQECVDAMNNAFFQEAQYYLALCLINAGEKEEGRKLMLKVSQSGDFYSRKAREFLDANGD
jgi:tetratricopeptide (TPR) repeat protein